MFGARNLLFLRQVLLETRGLSNFRGTLFATKLFGGTLFEIFPDNSGLTEGGISRVPGTGILNSSAKTVYES